ncbi:uncharacterized protein LOC125048360 [Penaeus chinensis]|uniref:uncharacterized protein LOC125048360 n=1 Tax=Penaeus chinensis TaxID=139456 RepID=UPI001FB7D726|nr:uncharacterized protein LOC125048360 [Penaeus chinensis]
MMLQAVLVCLAAGIAFAQTDNTTHNTTVTDTITTPAHTSLQTPTADYPNENKNAGLPPINAHPTDLGLNNLLTWIRGGSISQGIPAMNGAPFVVGFAPLIKPGQCPPLRTHCLPGYAQYLRTTAVLPGQICTGDFDCLGNNKCCYDVCLNESKPL